MAQARLDHQGCRNAEKEKFRRYWCGDTLIGLSCNECLSEWVASVYLLPDSPVSEVMRIFGETFHLIEKAYVDHCTFSIQPHTTRIANLQNIAEYLTAGDHIKYSWRLGLDHHAIVKDVQMNPYGPDRVTLIHWQGGGDGRKLDAKTTATVVEETVDDISTKATVVYRCDYNEGSVREDSKVLTLARAKAWIGETGYNLLKRNCEHFAVFCKLGRHWSFQGERLILRVVSFCREVWNQVLCAVGTNVVGDILEVGVGSRFSANILNPSIQLIGVGLVVVVQGVALCIDVKKLYDGRRDRNVTQEEFVGRIWHEIRKRVEKVFFTGVLPAGVVVGVGALLPTGAVAAGFSLLLGAFVAGALSMPWGYNGELSLGCHIVSGVVRYVITHRDVAVNDITQISIGDHIVVPMWFLHPRCHMIVTGVDATNRILAVIRFTYRKGVVEENRKFQTPMYKVLSENPLAPEEVIRRARSNTVSVNEYGIFSYNCKHFAFWCTTGKVPALP